MSGRFYNSVVGGKSSGKVVTRFEEDGMTITSTDPKYFRTTSITNSQGDVIDFSKFKSDIHKISVNKDKIIINDTVELDSL